MESGASQPSPWEESMSDTRKLSGRMEVDSIYTSGDHLKGGGLLGGVYTLQKTGLTGPISIYKLVPKVEYHTAKMC